MNVIQFAGFNQAEVDVIMPGLVSILNLCHDIYSVHLAPAVILYDKSGERQGTGNMIIVPGFDAVRKDSSLLNHLSQKFGVPVTCSMAEVKLALGDKLY